MKGMRLRVLVCSLAVASLSSPAWSAAQGTERPAAPADPLAGFERLIGGQWVLEGSHQEFEWGVGRLSVKARSYFMVEGKPKLVSEGVWFWHPGEKAVKGFATATDMPVVFFDYTTAFERDAIASELRSYTRAGTEQHYVETWTFTDDAHYLWRLLEKTPEGMREVMSGTYAREP